MDRVKTVTLLPGYLAPNAIMWPLSRHLKRDGLVPRIHSYRTRGKSLDQLARQFVETVAFNGQGGQYIVAHSLGALIVLQAMEVGLISPTRVVCIAPPVKGAAVARRVKASRLARLMGGLERRAALGLTLEKTYPEVGVIAGSLDVLVRPQDTDVPGADSMILPCGHNELLLHRRAHSAISRFLSAGRFEISIRGMQVRL